MYIRQAQCYYIAYEVIYLNLLDLSLLIKNN